MKEMREPIVVSMEHDDLAALHANKIATHPSHSKLAVELVSRAEIESRRNLTRIFVYNGKHGLPPKRLGVNGHPERSPHWAR
jgi:hypothetical protein